ncbi:hypothetical protein MMC30_008590 [Trapelia coarctata]|nr:hypothetical protein [Trapelia coarctata]
MASGFAILGAISASYAFAKDIVSYLKGLSDAKGDIESIMLRFENDTTILEHLEAFFSEDVVRSLGSGDLDHLQRVFSYLLPTLSRVSSELQGYSKNRKRDRLKWSVLGAALEKAEEQIFKWMQRLQTCLVFFPNRIKSDLVADFSKLSIEGGAITGVVVAQQRMQMNIERFRTIGYRQMKNQNEELKLAEEPIAQVDLRSTAQWRFSENTSTLVEYKRMPASMINNQLQKEELETDVIKLVSVLSVVRPTEMFLLRTKYFFETRIIPTAPFGVVYELPKPFVSPRRLIDVLLETDSRGNRILAHSLDQRFELARQVATALLFVHSIGWVHKGIRSSAVHLARRQESTLDILGTSFLAGFEYTRRDVGVSTGDEAAQGGWKRELYQHPQRCGVEEGGEVPPFTEDHDIYALGCLLVEIGRWKPLEAYPQYFKDVAALERKAKLEEMAGALNITMGQRYSDICARCLRVLDEGVNFVDSDLVIRHIASDLEELANATRSRTT